MSNITVVEPTQLVGLGSLVVLGDTTGQLQAVNGQTGQPLWTRNLASELFAAPAIALDAAPRLIVATEQGLYGLDLTTGETVWQVGSGDVAGFFDGGVTLFEADTIYGATNAGWLYRIEAATGQVDLAVELDEAEGFFHPPTIIEDQLFLASEGGILYHLDLTTERLLWQRSLFQAPATSVVIVPEFEMVVVGTEAQSVVAVSFEGERLWEEETPIFPNQLTVDWEGRLFVTDQENGLLAFDIEAQEVLWEVVSDEVEITVGPFATHNTLFYGNSVGGIAFLDSNEGIELDDIAGTTDAPILSLMPLNNALIVLDETNLYRLNSLQR